MFSGLNVPHASIDCNKSHSYNLFHVIKKMKQFRDYKRGKYSAVSKEIYETNKIK